MTSPNPGQYQQMGGGYDEAIRAANGQNGPVQPTQQWQPPTQSQLPPQMQPAPQRFGDPRPPSPAQQQAAAGQYVQQLPFMGQQQQYQAPQGVDINTRLSGPNIPADLQGRTLGEAVAIYNGLRQVHLQSLSQAPPVQSFQRPPIQGGGQQPSIQGGGQQAQNQGWDWRAPEKSVEAVVDRAMGRHMEDLKQTLAPTIQGTAMAQISAARAQAAAAVGPMFSQFEPQILQSLQGANPQILQNPNAWQVAAERIIGQAALLGARQGGGQAPQQQNFQQQPQQPAPFTGQPVPNLASFFSEQPNQGGPGAGGVQLTPQQRAAASAMSMSETDYSAWLGGAPRGGAR